MPNIGIKILPIAIPSLITKLIGDIPLKVYDQDPWENYIDNSPTKGCYTLLQNNFQLSNYLEDNNALDKEVNRIFESMDDTAIVAQLIMPAVGRLGQKKETIDQHIKDRVIGGVLMLLLSLLGFAHIRRVEADATI